MIVRKQVLSERDWDSLFGLQESDIPQLLADFEKLVGRERVERFLWDAIYAWISNRLNGSRINEHEMAIMIALLSYFDKFNIKQMPIFDDHTSKINRIHNKSLSKFPYDYSQQIIQHSYSSFRDREISPYISDYLLIKPKKSSLLFDSYPTPLELKRTPISDDDMLAVQRLLRDWDTLESIFVRFAQEFAVYARNYVRQRFDMFGKTVKSDHKLFTSFCKQWARQHGFSDFVKLRDGLTPLQFAQRLMNRELFDDIAFRQTPHGAIAHFMQWVGIIYHYEDTKFIQRTPAELYAWIGSEAARVTSDNNWFDVFEFGAGSSVFDMHGYLTSQTFQMKCPLLAEYIRVREGKSAPANYL